MLGSLPTPRDRGGAETRMEYVAPGSDWILPQLGSEPSVSQIKNRQFFNLLHDMRRHTAGVRTVPGRKSWGSALRGDL